MHNKPSDAGDGVSVKVGEVVSIYQRGKRWYANYQFEGKQCRESLQTCSQKQARVKALLLEAEILEGRHAKKVKAPTIGLAFTEYLAHLRTESKAAKTLQKVELVQRRVLDLAARRKAKSLLDLNLAFVDAYRAEAVQRKVKPAEPKTLLNETVIIRQLVNFALSRNMITSDPLRGLKLKKVKSKPQPCWTLDEVDLILATAKPPHKLALTLLAETGMRVGELKWLTWDDVDFEHGFLHIRTKPGWKPKTGDQRVVPMFPVVRALLQQLPRRFHWVLTSAPSKRYPAGDHQISERRLLQYLKGVLKRLKLRGHLHTFRHSFISNSLIDGAPEAVLRAWVGQLDPEVMKLYTHIADSASQAAMQRLAMAKSQRRKNPLGSADPAEANSAQFQHNRQEDQNARSAK